MDVGRAGISVGSFYRVGDIQSNESGDTVTEKDMEADVTSQTNAGSQIRGKLELNW